MLFGRRRIFLTDKNHFNPPPHPANVLANSPDRGSAPGNNKYREKKKEGTGKARHALNRLERRPYQLFHGVFFGIGRAKNFLHGVLRVGPFIAKRKKNQ